MTVPEASAPLLPHRSGVAVSTIYNLEWGGYRVRIDSSGIMVKTLTGWIFFDTPPIAEASLQQQLCNRVALAGKAEASTANFNYKDPVTAATLNQKNILLSYGHLLRLR